MSITVGIHGLMGHGKDTLAIMIAEEFRKIEKDSYYIHRDSFADILKSNVSNITGINRESDPSGDHVFVNTVFNFTREQKSLFLEDYGMTLGKFMQIYGTDACRDNISKTIWITSLLRKLKSRSAPCINIITDVRFENEVSSIKELKNSILIKIVRPDSDFGEGRDSNHESEKGLPDNLFNIIVFNNQGLEELRESAKHIAKHIYLNV